MNRKDFRALSKQGKLVTVEESQHLIYLTKKEVLKKAVNDYSAVVALSLRDELKFGHKRTAKFLTKVSQLFEDIQAGHLSIEDIKKQLHEEIGVIIN